MNNNPKNILLCDANFCILPIVQSIKSKGHTLSVMGSKPDDPGHAIADRSVNINYSDIEMLQNHISENSYDGIVPGCNDRSYLSLASIAEKMSFPGFDDYETVLTVHHKDRFRQFAEKHDYPIPKAVSSIENIESIDFPVLVKPVDSFSGKGINKAHNVDELKEYWSEAEKFSHAGLVVAEEFVEGKLYSHSAFIKNGKIIIDFFVNEYCTVYPYQVNSSNIAAELSEEVRGGLRSWTETFANDLNLCDGLIHTQFISNNSLFYLIEIARRCPGDLYSQLIQKSTGIDYANLYAMPFCGLELPDSIDYEHSKFVSRHTVSVDEDCIFISSGINIENTTVQNVQLKYSGEMMKAAPYDKSGIYFIEYKSKEEMETFTEKLKDLVKIEILDLSSKGEENNDE